jgi:hypothetical protein
MTDSRCKTDPGGVKRWFNELGQCHRLDGPAAEYPSGLKEWWVDGKLHRLDGHAIEWYSYKEWWIDGVELTQQEFERHPLVVFYRLSEESRCQTQR